MSLAPQMSDLTLGGRIRIARQEAGLSATELARRLEVARETLSAWENGHQELKAGALRQIAEITNASADWLLFGTTRRYLSGPRSHLHVVDGGKAALLSSLVPDRKA